MMLATLIFVITYGVIVTERVHRTTAALVGAVAMLLAGRLTQDEAFRAIDLNVIFLLAGMMIIADLTRETGIFQWLAIKAVKLARGDPFRILVMLSVLTAGASALLDNVTVVVLVGPLTLLMANSLQVSPAPFLIAEILASNIGGAATLIGDPPNLLIGSAADLDFADFLVHMAPVSLLILAVFLITAWFLFKHELESDPAGRATVLEMDEREVIGDRKLLRQCIVVIALTLIGFLVHGALGLEPATVALSGAALLLLWTRRDPYETLREVEWTTLFFFVGLFIVVEGVVKAGLIDWLARGLLAATQGQLALTTIILLWLSAILSGIVDNIPYTATMIPLVKDMGQFMPIEPLWWALALGADLGGNATLVGASANVVIASLAERGGVPISFRKFLKYGLIVTFESMLIATVYVWLRYLR
ncbi:MAG: hypothetical protein A2Z04_08420 [Chloroflexi bacterium RBG_16_57_9]|nr:MAG: hypothetical protein A2Z04_08420 [Chloroflexi bacterium RBG_16_57_9]